MKATPPSSTVTRLIWFWTLVAVALVGAMVYSIYRSAIQDTVAQHSTQQLAIVRTAAAAIRGEIQAMAAQLRQFAALPSVQTIDPILSQRINASFGQYSGPLISLIVRTDAGGQLYYWEPDGTVGATARPGYRDEGLWAWASNRAHLGEVRMVGGWANAVPSRRVLVTPVWRTSPSGEYPQPPNDFNGLLGLVIDLERVVETYLGPALDDLGTSRLVVGLATPSYGLIMRPGVARPEPAPADPHEHVELQGTSILSDADGQRVHAWTRFDAADEPWLVAVSAPYAEVAGQIRRSTAGLLALSAVLLVAIPVVGVVVARRERRAQDEQRRLERQLAESQKMEAIGKLAGGVAHDFNNMLTAILGYASMIAEDTPPGSSIHEEALQIRRAGESAATLTQKLLAFSRRQVLQVHHVDLGAMLDSVTQLIRRVIGEHITVVVEADAGLWPILADPGQVEQSMVNLAINARDAMPDGGTLTITARNAPRPAGERRADGEVRPGDYVQITVTDTGVGMDDDTKSRMFEPFFTTKAHGQGTGLGLSTVYGFVRQCDGHIAVVSAPGQGTTIELLLPRAAAVVERTPTPVPDTAARAGGETVLVAEDEEAVRLLAVQSLERHGYRVMAAASGEEALAAAARFDGAIHLLLTDVVMPGIKGPELARRLRALRPGVRVLLMSGYAADVVTPGDLETAALVSKPFSAAVLARAVRQALDRPLSSSRASQG